MARPGDPRLLAIVGDPVSHSLSPAMHNAAMQALGIPGTYVALKTPAAALASVLSTLTTVGAAGNVTVPHKEAAAGYVARKTDACTRTGACNTFWVENGTLVGDNTDVIGVSQALDQLGVGRGGRWLVLGTGGSARAVAAAAVERGAILHVKSRTHETARRFVEWARSVLSLEASPADNGAADVVINATPLGMRDGDALPLVPERVGPSTVVLDLVYRRGGTALVQEVEKRGRRVSDGRTMLVAQGAAAFERFFPGVHAPVEVMRAAVERALRD
ncbi:MAG TPA: shikimate dehydrogenase [Gemmatimonadales bacterium]|nr:shikimate dehydrogenase [Gemmatimonadales bacterium]